ncbi:MAG: hypothetical protein JXA99_14575 [Candidatus Lokiarchaeota archaeon]|nr:hypothetical protein [Candidatus Lokiarchaeota archaeon]
MLKKRKTLTLLAIIFIFFAIGTMIHYSGQSTNYITDDPPYIPKSSSILDNVENIIITHSERYADITLGGITNIEDKIDFKNYGSNPIYAVVIGVPLNLSTYLITYDAMGESNNHLYAERTGLIMSDKYEMLTIYLESPIEHLQTKRVVFTHSYIGLVINELRQVSQTDPGLYYYSTYNAHKYPLLPYRCEGSIGSIFHLPLETDVIYNDEANNGTLNLIKYQTDKLEPFSENLGGDAIARFRYTDFSTKLWEIVRLNRDISISPWGTLIITEDISIKNWDLMELYYFPMYLPKNAMNIQTYDSLGDIAGTRIERFSTYTLINLSLYINRAVLTKNDVYDFTLKYTLTLGDYLSTNWLQQSIKMDIFLTKSDFLIREQTTRIIIDGCMSIDSISKSPLAIENTLRKTTLTFIDSGIISIMSNEILITYTINLFDLLLRPIVLILIISILSALYIIYVRKKKDRRVSSAVLIETLPQSEIREYCSLNEEKNALILEIRKTQEDLLRKKIPKKKFRTLVEKNESKIKLIEEEIKPFKKVLVEADATLEGIVQNIDIVEAERQTVEDGLKLLDSRYKKGKLPSKNTYEKLLNDFFKRRKKIDRTIDRYIQQLRNYLL